MEKSVNRLNKLKGKKIYRTEANHNGDKDWMSDSFVLASVSAKGILGIWFGLGIGLPVLLGPEWIDDKWESAKNT